MVARSPDADSQFFFVPQSRKMQQVYAQIAEAARSDASVLITGENGTGKGVAARQLHSQSARRDAPLVTIDTTLFPRELVETELFGIVKGAVPGVVAKEGLVHCAVGGVLLFDEIGDMLPELQPKLLRFVQERRFRRVGGTKEESIDVRCLFATNRNLEEMIREGRFRQDLFYRIRDIRIRLPPLRECPEDIIPLARHFCVRKARQLGLTSKTLDVELERQLRRHDWPGNVRELEACISTLVERSRNSVVIGVDRLPDDMTIAAAPAGDVPPPKSNPSLSQPHPGPPLPSDPAYQRVPRNGLVHQILTSHLLPRRVAVLLQTHRGGGRSLARQIAAQSGMQDIWLVDSSHEQTAPEHFFRQLTRNPAVRDQSGLDDWLRDQVRRAGRCLVIQTEPRGPEELLECVAATLRSLLEQDSNVQFLLIGSERLLRLRTHERYSWLRLLPPSALIDVPDLTVEEIARLLRSRGQPEARAALLHEQTGGHPWLVYELVTKNISDPAAARAEVRYQLQTTRRLQRHLADSQSREVLQKLLRGEPVTPLNDRSIRHNPERHAIARLYFDGLVMVDGEGKTRLRGEGMEECGRR